MSLLDRINHLQRESVQKRKTVLVIIVTILMIGVISIWIAQLKYESRVSRNTATTANPFQIIWNSAYDAITEGVNQF